MQVITIDKKKTPEIADWATDKEPGDRVCLYGTIKANDDQSLTITVDEVGDEPEEKDETDKLPEGGNEGSDAAPPAQSLGGGMSEMMDEQSAV